MKKIIGRVTKGVKRVLTMSVNPCRLSALRRQRALKLHLGCGDDRLDGFINIDYRPTRATDVITDLNKPKFDPNSVAFAFSNAFFEHLYRDSRLGHLKCIYDSLETNGVCCYMGIPYFRNIARFYLERGPGTAGPIFDLYNVYRYTHGAPEQVPSWWLGQLHKSLFDEEELSVLLRASGFTTFVLFCYGHPGDTCEAPVTMGFYASRDNRSEERLRDEVRSFLLRFADKKIRMKTLEWLVQRS